MRCFKQRETDITEHYVEEAFQLKHEVKKIYLINRKRHTLNITI